MCSNLCEISSYRAERLLTGERSKPGRGKLGAESSLSKRSEAKTQHTWK